MSTSLTAHLLGNSPHAVICAIRVASAHDQCILYLDPTTQQNLGRTLDAHALCELAYMSYEQAARVMPYDPQDNWRGSLGKALDKISHTVAAKPTPWVTNHETHDALHDLAISQQHSGILEVLKNTTQEDVSHFDHPERAHKQLQLPHGEKT